MKEFPRLLEIEGSANRNTITSWRGYDIPKLQELADAGYGAPEIYLTQIDSDWPKDLVDRRAIELEKELNDLLALFSIDPNTWQNHALKLKRDNNFSNPVVYKETIQKKAAGATLAESLREWAYMNLRIENEEEGHGRTELVIGLNDNLKVTLMGSGDHWSGHHYKDPDTDGIISEAWDDDRIHELMARGEDMDKLEVEYEIACSLKYSAFFSRPGAPDSPF